MAEEKMAASIMIDCGGSKEKKQYFRVCCGVLQFMPDLRALAMPPIY